MDSFSKCIKSLNNGEHKIYKNSQLNIDIVSNIVLSNIVCIITTYLRVTSYYIKHVVQREQRLFYISHYSVTEINPFHDGSVAENTTEQVNWYFLSAVVSSWKGLTLLYVCFFHDIEYKYNIFNYFRTKKKTKNIHYQ